MVQVGDLPAVRSRRRRTSRWRGIGLRGSLRFRRDVAEAVGLIGAGRGAVLAIVTARRPGHSVSPSTGTAA